MGISTYTTELGDEICIRIATSTLGLRHICEALDVPYSTVTGWIYDDKHEMSEKYTRAKRMQADHMAEELLDIVDDGSNDLMTIVKGDESYEMENKEVTNRSRLRADTRKWLMSKILPKKYGDKLDVTSGDKPINAVGNLSPEQLNTLLQLQDAAGANKPE